MVWTDKSKSCWRPKGRRRRWSTSYVCFLGESAKWLCLSHLEKPSNECFKSPLETQLNVSASEVILLYIFFINVLFCSHEFIKWERFLYFFPCLTAFLSCSSFNVLSTLGRGKFSWASLHLTIEELANSTRVLSLVPPNTNFRNISVHGTLATAHGILPQNGLLLYPDIMKKESPPEKKMPPCLFRWNSTFFSQEVSVNIYKFYLI